MKIQLEVLSGPMDGHVFQFSSSTRIGREEKIKLHLDRFVSRSHAGIEVKDSSVFVNDPKSTNGTFVDDERIQGRAQLSSGQIFRVGRTWLQINW